MSGPVTHYFNNSAATNTSRYADSINGSQASYRPDREHNNLSSLEFQKLAENRSLYGSYLDNALAFDPHKEKKSMYDIVYTQDMYDPWGKPGGGAPQLDNSTGRIKTKITGTMQWNLDGKTPSARSKKLMSSPIKTQPNLVEFRKTPNQLVKLPLNTDATTYRYSPQSTMNDPTFLEKQAEIREKKRKMQNQSDTGVNNNYFQDQNQQNQINNNNNNNNSSRYYSSNSLNNSSNFNGNMANSNDYMNYNPQQQQQQQPPLKHNAKFVDTSPALWTKMWFGRPGGGAPTYDPRRRKLMDQLEQNNNSISKASFYNSTSPNGLQTYRSTHRNFYDGAF